MVRAPVDRGDLAIVPGHLLAKRTTDALQCSTFDLVAHAIGIRNGAAVLRNDEPSYLDLAAVLIHGDVGYDRDIAVVPFVAGAGDATTCDRARASAVWSRRRASLPIGGFGGGAHGSTESRVIEVLQPVLDRVRLHMRRHFVHEAFMRERILQALGRAQGS